MTEEEFLQRKAELAREFQRHLDDLETMYWIGQLQARVIGRPEPPKHV